MKKSFICIICCLLAALVMVACTPVAEEKPAEDNIAEEIVIEEETEDSNDGEMVIIEIDEEALSEEEAEEEPYSNLMPYSKLWLFRYAPASVAPLSEQVGDNGIYDEIESYPDPSTYKLIMDYHNQAVWVLAKDEFGDFTQLERVMICSSGGNGNWTPEGNYAMGEHKVRFGEFKSDNCFGQYWSQIYKRFYFHSLLYDQRSAATWTRTSYNNLGTPVSHGCVRLFVPDARWVYYNAAPGTQCIITTDIERNEYLRYALRHGYEGATDVLSENEEYPVIYTWQVEDAHEKTWQQVLDIAKTAPLSQSEAEAME